MADKSAPAGLGEGDARVPVINQTPRSLAAVPADGARRAGIGGARPGGLSLVHQTLMVSGVRAKVIPRLQRQLQSVVLVTWLCLRPEPGDDRDLDRSLPNKEAP